MSHELFQWFQLKQFVPLSGISGFLFTISIFLVIKFVIILLNLTFERIDPWCVQSRNKFCIVALNDFESLVTFNYFLYILKQ